MKLVIVESPTKSKTISKFLGKEYRVESSYGHIRDLPKGKKAIDIENGFKPNYEIPHTAKKRVNDLKKASKGSDEVILAVDEDREGEAIAWHLKEALGLKDPKRIVFHEITKEAIQEALEKPRDIDMKLVDAQQARRILDRLVGYELSPVLWKKVQVGLSAGRVQSVTLRLIVEREREIEAFEPESSFRVTAVFTTENGETLEAEMQKRLSSAKEAKELLESLKVSDIWIDDISKKPAKRTPAPPFTTSTLQQEASRKLGFSVRQTMMVAQRLYESGKITYMRTDSFNLSETALSQMESEINNKFGEEYSKRRRYTTKSAGAQEAHEAIRPTSFGSPEISGNRNEQRLYHLVWQRTMSSQMADAQLERTNISITSSASDHKFTAKGEIVVFDGFLKLYDNSKKEDGLLPNVKKGEKLKPEEITARETFTRPPARYTEATLVRKLEELGIGRPSTYAPTIYTVQARGYAEKADLEGYQREVKIVQLKEDSINEEKEEETTGADKGKLIPSDLGKVVSDFLVKHFPEVIDYKFTAEVEKELDEIAEGQKKWNSMISSFYGDFHKTVKEAENVSREEAGQMRDLGKDPETGKTVLARLGRYGPMVQVGRTEDQEEKPRFASAPPNKALKDITLEDALQMLSLPRILGEKDGENITAQTGRFGPYIKHGKTNASIPQDKLFTITLDEAKEILKEKQEEAANRIIKQFDGIQILKGRFGPYITDGKKNAKIPKDKEPEDVTEEEAKELIEKAPVRKKRRVIKRSRS